MQLDPSIAAVLTWVVRFLAFSTTEFLCYWFVHISCAAFRDKLIHDISG